MRSYYICAYLVPCFHSLRLLSRF